MFSWLAEPSAAELSRTLPSAAELSRAFPSPAEPSAAERGRAPGSVRALRGAAARPRHSAMPRGRAALLALGALLACGLLLLPPAARRHVPARLPANATVRAGVAPGDPAVAYREAAAPRSLAASRWVGRRLPASRRAVAVPQRAVGGPAPCRALVSSPCPPQSPAGPTCCCCTARPSAPARGRPWARWRCSPLRDTAPSPSTCLVGARVPGRCRTSKPAHGRPKGLAGPSRCTSAPHPLFPPPPQAMGIRPPRGRWPRSGVGRPSCGTSCSGWACGGRSSSARP